MYEALKSALITHNVNGWTDEINYSDTATRIVMLAYVGDDNDIVTVEGCWTTDTTHPHHHAA